MDQLYGLSSRELQVAKLLLEGKSNKQIASALHITDNTVEFHLKNIYSKCQVSSRTEFIIKLAPELSKDTGSNTPNPGGLTTPHLTVGQEPGNSVVAEKDESDENKDRQHSSNGFATLKEAVSTIYKELKMESVFNSTTPRTQGPMAFGEAIIVCLKKYADFNGRASRAEFWWFTLFILLVASALTYLSQNLGNVFLVAVLLPLLAAGARRLRDSGKSLWWELFLLAPVGGLMLLAILWASPSTNPEPGDTLPA